jgi:Raf kinase inhibitor-like YbhB/YbcL family protein
MLQNLPDFVGHALREQRAGLDKTVYQRVQLRGGQATIRVTSLAFIDHAPIPLVYTADGEGLSPPLQWSNLPAGTRSVVLLVEDADSPTPLPLVHAIAVGLSPEDGFLLEGALNDDKDGVLHPPHTAHARLGRNSYLQAGWMPPDPPPGHGQHRYAFQVFALDSDASLPATPGRDALLDVLPMHALASGCLIGTYERNDTSVSAAAENAAQGAAVA